MLVIRATGVSCKVKASYDSVAGEMLRDLGCVNVADSDAALLESLSLEAVIAAEPDYIFAVLQGSDPERAMETLSETLLSNPAWSGLRAVREGRFYTLEHELYNLKPNARWGRPMKSSPTYSTHRARLFALLAAMLAAAAALSLALGPVGVPLGEVLRALFSGTTPRPRRG